MVYTRVIPGDSLVKGPIMLFFLIFKEKKLIFEQPIILCETAFYYETKHNAKPTKQNQGGGSNLNAVPM